MKKLLLLPVIAAIILSVNACSGDKSKRPSPPAKVTETTNSGVTITIDYSQPAVKGRSIGKDIAPYGEVWRTGANEATVFEIDKDVTIEGKPLKAGKYSLYSIPGHESWVFIFNKTWDQWGTEYKQADDVLRVDVKNEQAPQFTERMTFTINKSGTVSLLWGNVQANFAVQ